MVSCIKVGDTVKIEAYRVPDTVVTAQFVGMCEGKIEASGFVASSKDNVTTKETNEIKTVRKYR